MQMRRSASLPAGGTCAVLLGLAAVLPVAEPVVELAAGLPASVAAPPVAGGLLLVRHAGTGTVTLDTTHLAGPSLRAWWTDGIGDRTVDGGAVRRGSAVTLHPPDTGDASPHDWTLVVVDATRGLVPPA
jgi:hypothetical protein